MTDEEIYAAAKRFYKYECDDNPLSGIADFDEVGFARALLASYGAAQPSASVPVLAAAMALLVAGGFVTEEKVGEAIEIAKGGATPPAAAQAQQDADKADANTGHGHVLPRPDGVKARCGGPGICKECSRDAARAQQGGRQ